MIETCRCKETSWNARSSTEPERKARTARKKLRVLRLGHPPFSEMMEGTSGRTGTATDLDGDTKIEAAGWGEVLFIRRFAFGPRNRPSLNYKRISEPVVSGIALDVAAECTGTTAGIAEMNNVNRKFRASTI